MTTGRGSAETAVEAMTLGACDYLTKPVALITGETGTGKELVARSVRILADLMHKILVPQRLSPQGRSRPSVVAIGDIFKEQLHPFGAGHHLEVSLEPRVNLRGRR